MALDQKFNFAFTCNLLSQYMKDKVGLGDFRLGMITPAAGDGNGKISGTPRTMNLLPGIETSTGETSLEENKSKKTETLVTKKPGNGESRGGQMTIFYAGKVIAINNFPEDKAMGLMEMIGKAATPASAPPASLSPAAIANKITQHLSIASDLPIARRASLSRFLEKRKNRVVSKAPYQVNCSSSPAAASATPVADQEKAPVWLGLASANPVVHQQ